MPLQAHGQTTLFGGSTACSCGFHTIKPTAATSTQAAAVPPQSEAPDTAPVPGSFMRPPPSLSMEPPEPIDIPTSRWLLSVYGRDILSRIDHIKASITSIFGNILKMDSTKQITKKLAGHGRGQHLGNLHWK
ncbi:hypothetical protein QQF64_023698 [Cirrhinus molitorella]|uniref:Uncharacterized protein n=1 Tax=Cirrhinus molitorella TaxID=172907 RepID=A0ABR3NJA8_9TELE